MSGSTTTHLDDLESESIYIIREAVAESGRVAMLYSVGKDSSVLLRLAQKAYYPANIPFPLIHIDTGFKFPEMIEFRDRTCRELGLEMIVCTNQVAKSNGTDPSSSAPAAAALCSKPRLCSMRLLLAA
jgi:sulfate adenylyltransferase subunit 2